MAFEGLTRHGWYSATDPVAMLGGRTGLGAIALPGRIDDATIRLVACAWARLFWTKMSPASRAAIELAEELACGASPVRQDSEAAYIAAFGPNMDQMAFHCFDWGAADTFVNLAIVRGIWLDRTGTPSGLGAAALCDVARDVAYDPWMPPIVMPGGLDGWLTEVVAPLTRGCMDFLQGDGTPDPARVAVLADAVEEGGLGGHVLAHLRGEPVTLPCPRCHGIGLLDKTVQDMARLHEGYKTKIVRVPCDRWAPAGQSCVNGVVTYTAGPHTRSCWALRLLAG